ncbi:MAG: type II toxin-antitoxin system RelE/ParE family toxin [Roseburia sp.]|nr:type II toxin-antitoxin system RelE/ParE family toxin [Roseburia sp.]MCM1243912.1 type II toxin-antitoxin system RelE/ParE family toxin [Roseburia sp.]
MDYEVILTYPAKAQLDHAVNYILCEFENEQAARSVIADAEDTRLRLSHVAGSLKLCDDPKLRALGYRTIHFKHHKYFMLYRIEGDKVYVDGVYHDSQDYENITR